MVLYMVLCLASQHSIYVMTCNDYVLIDLVRSGHTGKYLARGDAVRTKRSEVSTNDQEPNIFPYGPT